MREVAEREGIDLDASFAYSDSESDLPMLRAVGHAVVVNPDPDLRRIAVEEGWEVVRLDRLGRRLKWIAAVGAGTMLASLGRVVRERRPARVSAPARTRGRPRAAGGARAQRAGVRARDRRNGRAPSGAGRM
jgi:hypothetical protein